MGALLEKAGIPVVSIVADEYLGVAETAAKSQGLTSLARAVIPFDVMSGAVKDVTPACEKVLKDIIHGLTHWVPASEDKSEELLTFEGPDYQAAVDRMEESYLLQNHSDGLPLVPPTQERVDWILTGTNRSPDALLTAQFGPRFSPIRVRDVAVNAVMAGARPEYLPVILAAVSLLATDEGLKVVYPLTESQHTFAPVLLINGPIANELRINASIGMMGPGSKPNAVIGRALNLVLINGAGAYAGPDGTPATHSLPGRYTWCFAESEGHSPWEPMHVEYGYDSKVSTVTVLAGRGTQAIMVSPPADKILNAIVRAMKGITVLRYPMPWDQLLILSPAHARLLAEAGLSKSRIRAFVYENARISNDAAQDAGKTLAKDAKKMGMGKPVTGEAVPLTESPDNLLIMVAGATGANNSSFVPCMMKKVTGEIDSFKSEHWEKLIHTGNQELLP